MPLSAMVSGMALATYVLCDKWFFDQRVDQMMLLWTNLPGISDRRTGSASPASGGRPVLLVTDSRGGLPGHPGQGRPVGRRRGHHRFPRLWRSCAWRCSARLGRHVGRCSLAGLGGRSPVQGWLKRW